MTILIDNQHYKVRHNYMHRLRCPRLVLEFRLNGGFVEVQFDNNSKAYYDYSEGGRTEEHRGYWIVKGQGILEVTIKFLK